MLKQFITILICYFCIVMSASAAPLQAVFEVKNNNADHTFAARITLKNNSDKTIHHWQLALTSIRPILSVAEGNIDKQIGGFNLISPKNAADIPPQGAFVFNLTGKWFVKREAETPSGYFLVITDPTTKTTSTLPVAAKIIFPPKLTKAARDEYTHTRQKNQTSIENNPVIPTITPAQSQIIPLPADVKLSKGTFTLNANTVLIADHNATAAANFFAQEITPATGYSLRIQKNTIDKTPANSILLTEAGADPALGAEGYLLQISPTNIIIKANSDTGFFYAVQSLRQLFSPFIFNKQLQTHIIWNLPALSIRDYPRFAYRGFSLDVARHFIPADQIRRLLDLMALHKLNKFQWHLADDEGWRIEIKKYPALTTLGAWRGLDNVLPPALGSKAKTYGGYYSQAEIRDIVKYAARRHITIIPEIDMPGHARAMIMSLPAALIDPQDTSQYTSVQNYHDNVLSPCLASTYEVIDNIFTEISALFPGDMIHVGSDEVPKNVWTASPRCQSLMAATGLKNTEELQNYFLKRVQQIIHTKHKKMAGWEEVLKSGDLDKSTVIYSWKSEEAGIDAAKRGYPVVMMPAQFLYFDLAYTDDQKEPGFSWAGFVDTFQTYTYQPIQSSWTPDVTQKILGIQGALWSENVSSRDQLDYLVFPKLLALSEVAWTPKQRRNWINFSERVGKLHLQRLDQYGVKYRISLPGINLKNNNLEANIEFPGLILRYTLDQTTPSSDALLYTKPVKITGTVNMRAFNSINQGSRTITRLN
jgi:hexosaminidase